MSDPKRRHPTENGPSQRGLSWTDWLANRPPAQRFWYTAAFVGFLLWLALHRWGAC